MVKGNKAALAIIEEQKAKGKGLSTAEQNAAAQAALEKEQVGQRIPDAKALAEALKETKAAAPATEQEGDNKKGSKS